MDRMKVSVIVPMYKVEKYLDRCIKSIINQTYKNLEIILVDDGSPDSSGNIAEGYAQSDSRIRVIHKENGGLSDARNAGIIVASGDYICFVDSDDSIDEHFVEELIKACASSGADIAVCNYLNVIKPEDIPPYDSKNNANIVVQNSLEALNSIYSQDNVVTIVAWNKLYRRELWNDILFPVGRIHEDEATTYKLLYKAKKIVRIDKSLYYYFKNDESITGSQYSLKRLDILWAIESRMDFYKSKALEELYYKDSYKYLCKLLTSYYNVAHTEGDNKEILKSLMKKYHTKLKECLGKDIGWSVKRRCSMLIFGVCPMAYAIITGKR